MTVKPIANANEQQEVRRSLGLPPHFCTNDICHHNTKTLPGPQKGNGKHKWIVAVCESNKNAYWHFSEEKTGIFTLSNDTTSRRSISVRVDISRLRDTVATATTKRFVLYEIEPGLFVQLKKEDVQRFLTAAQKR